MIDVGYLYSRKIHQMSSAKIFKPSKYKEEEMIQQCETLRVALIKYIECVKTTNSNFVDDNISVILSNFTVSTLMGCKTVAENCFNLGRKLQRTYTESLYLPIAMGLNLGECTILMVTVAIILSIIKLF